MDADEQTPSDAPGAPQLQLEAVPAFRDNCTRQHHAIRLLHHHDVVTHLVWCAAASRYVTGGADGEVKLWKSDVPASVSSSFAPFPTASTQPPTASLSPPPCLIPERHITTLGGPVTGLCVNGSDAGSSEVVVIASTDGTLTICRTCSGEVMRTLRGARGESLESCTIPAVQVQSAGMWAAEQEQTARRTSARAGSAGKLMASTYYAADAYSRRLAPSSDVAVVRRPVYAIHAYRDEVQEMFTGPSNELFQGMHAIAPTYAHLTPHEDRVADVLSGFGEPATSAAIASPARQRQWYASAVSLAAPPETYVPTNTRQRSSSATGTATLLRDLYLVLGFPQGLVQVYVLPRRWFLQHMYGETRLDSPTLRFPVLSTLLHAAAVVGVEATTQRDLMVSVGEDATIQLRRLSSLQTPFRQLGGGAAGGGHGVPRSPSITARNAFCGRSRSVDQDGHTRCVTCCCIDTTHQLLVTSSADRTLCWWSLVPGSAPSPVRVVSLRDASSNAIGAVGDALDGAAGTSHTHGGFPVDLSFFHWSADNDVARSDSIAGARRSTTTCSIRSKPLLFLLVLDSEQVVRVFNAVSGHLALVRAGSVSAPNALSDHEARVRRRVRLIRFDNGCAVPRFLLGGLFPVPWYFARAAGASVVLGHTEPILYAAWSTAGRCLVTADEHHILLWGPTTAAVQKPRKEETKTAPARELVKSANGAPMQLLGAWRVPDGIRVAALCEETDGFVSPHGRFSVLLAVALKKQTALVVYECSPLLADASTPSSVLRTILERELREPPALRRLALGARDGECGAASATQDSVTAMAACLCSSWSGTASEASTAYVCGVCQCNDELNARKSGVQGSRQASSVSTVRVYAIHQGDSTRTGPADAIAAAAHVAHEVHTYPQREVRLPPPANVSSEHDRRSCTSGDIVVSVLTVPERNLLVVGGGHRRLYTASLDCFSFSAATAVACVPLAGGPMLSSHEACAKQPACLTAVVPGPLMELSDADRATATATAFMNPDAALKGHLSRLALIPAACQNSSNANVASLHGTSPPCLTLSGSNDGLLQLWDIDAGKELWRCCAVLTGEPITALGVHCCAARWLVAVGDQTGAVTLLDLTHLILDAAGRLVPSASGCGVKSAKPLKTGTVAPADTTAVASDNDVFMVDRWQAHTTAVTSVCFAADDVGVDGCPCFFTTGEDAMAMQWAMAVHGGASTVITVATGAPLYTQGGAVAHLTRPGALKLSWVTRQAYRRLRERYVQLHILDKYPEAQGAFEELDGSVDGTKNAAAVIASEYVLVSQVWSMVTANAHALAAADNNRPGAPAAALRRRMMAAWCTSLTGTFPSSVGIIGAAASTSASPLFFAFADRCCSAVDNIRADDLFSGSGTAHKCDTDPVRECLRRALWAVVRSHTEAPARQTRASSSTTLQAPDQTLVPQLLPRASAASSLLPLPRPSGELFSAVATVSALAHMSASGYPASKRASSSVPAATVTSATKSAVSMGVAFPRSSSAVAVAVTSIPAHAKQPSGSTSTRATVVVADATASIVGARRTTTLADHDDTQAIRLGLLGRGSNAVRESVVLATACLSSPAFSAVEDGDSVDDGELEDNENSTSLSTSGAAAAAVVELVHRSRRRHHHNALQRLAGVKQAEAPPSLCGTVRRQGNRSGGGHRLARFAPAHRDDRADGGAGVVVANAKATAVPATRVPVVTDTYLTPVLARVMAEANTTGDAAGLESSNSMPSTWYAIRQKRRAVVQQNARLWNAPRVMQTLMRWTGKSPLSGGESPRRDKVLRVLQASPVSFPASSSPSSLPLPSILCCRSAEELVKREEPERNAAPAVPLQALLQVSPTAAIDRAVPSGLPSRETLRSEMDAREARMRQSVRQRAAQQLQNRAAAAASAIVTASAKPLELTTADDTENEVSASTFDGSAVNNADDGSFSRGAATSTSRSSPDPTAAATGAAAASSFTSPARHRVVATTDHGMWYLRSRAGRRHMATVPLPIATTRRELLTHKVNKAKS